MEIVPLAAFRDNYIWALVANPYCAVIDPGNAAPVLAFLQERHLQLSAILITHHHHDHTGGIAALLARHPAASVYGPLHEDIGMAAHKVAENDVIHLPAMACALRVFDIPGHTAGHIAFYQAPHLFCGDTLFAAGCGRVLGGTIAQLFASLQRLQTLPATTCIHCAHEYTLANLRFAQHVEPDNPAIAARLLQCQALRAAGRPTLPTTLTDELTTNPFLRCQQATVREQGSHYAGQPLTDDLAVFAALRDWKNHF